MNPHDLVVSVMGGGGEMRGTVWELVEKGLWKAWGAQ